MKTWVIVYGGNWEKEYTTICLILWELGNYIKGGSEQTRIPVRFPEVDLSLVTLCRGLLKILQNEPSVLRDTRCPLGCSKYTLFNI